MRLPDRWRPESDRTSARSAHVHASSRRGRVPWVPRTDDDDSLRTAPESYFGDADGEGLAGEAAGLIAVAAGDVEGAGFAAGVVPGEAPAAPGATVAGTSGGLMLRSSTSKIRVAFGPISRPAPRSP